MDSVAQKTCGRCGEISPATTEFFPKNKNCAGGLFPWCKPCTRVYHKEWDVTHRPMRVRSPRPRQRPFIDKSAIVRSRTEKRCGGCGKTLPLEMFGTELKRCDGRGTTCRICKNNRERTRRRVNMIPKKRKNLLMRSPGFVYLIKMGEYFKIGFAKDPVQRLSQLRIGVPVHNMIELVCRIRTEYMRLLERQLHERFQDRRGSGEWFALALDEVEEIKRLAI